MSEGFATLQEMIVDGLGDAALAEHGRQLTRYEITVGTELIGVGVPGNFVTLTVAPVGFPYKAQKFGIDMNTLLTPAELEARKTYLVNEPRTLAGAPEAQTAPASLGATAQPIAETGGAK